MFVDRLNIVPRIFNIAKMVQPSIKNFFKPTNTPSKEKVTNDTAENLSSASKKRPADSEKSPKRQALSSPNKHQSDNPDKIKGDLQLTQDVKTPSKLSLDPKSPTTPSSAMKQSQGTLVDTRVIIRKKISSGSYALHENIGLSWFRALQEEFDKPYFKKLSEFVQSQRDKNTVFPPDHKVYTWTRHHDIKDTRVVILGQDPYHGPGQAHGLSFSVQPGVRLPPSLVNIFKELENDIAGFKTPANGDLTGWAKQGVLMLNACLTVNQGQANSHQNKGWEIFTDAVISWLSKNSKNNLVFLLWGRPAQKKATMIGKRHKVLTSAHPSPLSAHNGFFGCSHFSKTNEFLRSQNLVEIDWKAL